ncbi:MAG: transposase [Acidimicrobiales bacterium]|nr:transposase [Acidimicrobiales bacterium]
MTLGVELKNSRPYHPQTCGKVERFHQTLKKYLARQDPAVTKKQLQAQLDRFVRYYNEVRPHRAIGRQRPVEVYRARTKAYPQGPKIDCDGYRVRRDKVGRGGGVTLRYKGVLRHIGVGRAFVGQRVLLLVAGARVRVLTTEGDLIRTVKIDPAKIYQPMP